MLDDLYRILEVDPRAGREVIQAAYRARARVIHPDVTGSDEEMKRLNQAWEVLKDPVRRATYDRQRALARGEAEPDAREDDDAMPWDIVSRDLSWAGPPPGKPYGTVLPFGRYKGWSMAEIARFDPDWLAWLVRVPAGKRFSKEIEGMLADVRAGRDPAPFRHRDLFADAI
jgi:curved DNA-binding protein CbpA